MDLTRTAVRALAGACALTLLLAACGGDDDSAEVVDDTAQTTEADAPTTTAAEDETTTTAADDDTTTSTEAEDPDDTGDPDDSGDGTEGDPDAVALAQRINLTLDDFDEGWTETPPEDDDEGRNIDDCFVETDIEAATVGEAETGSFAYEPSDEAVQIVSMQTAVLESSETAAAIVAEFTGDAFATCAADVMTEGFGDGAAVDVALRADDPAWTEESTGLVGDITIPGPDGASYSGALDLHVLRTAEVVSFTATIDIAVDGIEGLLGQIYDTVAERHATEVG